MGVLCKFEYFYQQSFAQAQEAYTPRESWADFWVLGNPVDGRYSGLLLYFLLLWFFTSYYEDVEDYTDDEGDETDFDEEFYDYINPEAFASGLDVVDVSEDWDLVVDVDDICEGELNFEDEDAFEDWFVELNEPRDEFIEGEEDEAMIDEDHYDDFFLDIYNSGEDVDDIFWRSPYTPQAFLAQRSYLNNEPYLNEFLGINSHLLNTGELEYPSEPESYIVKYDTYWDDFDPVFWQVPPTSDFFYRDWMMDMQYAEYTDYDPFSEGEDITGTFLGLYETHDMFEEFMLVYRREEEEEYEPLSDDEDDEDLDLFIDYTEAGPEAKRMDAMYAGYYVNLIDEEFEEEDVPKNTIDDFEEEEDDEDTLDNCDEILFNDYQEASLVPTSLDEGDHLFFNVFPNVNPLAFADFEDDEDDEGLTEISLFDLMDIYVGSLYYREFSDVDPSWFWDFRVLGLSTADQVLNNLLDNFSGSSLDLYTDELLLSEEGQFILLSDAVLLKYEHLSEMEQRVYDLKMLYVSLSTLKDGKQTFYPVRFNPHHLFYECFNYSFFKWVSIKDVVQYSRAEFSFHEQEFLIFFGGLQPLALLKKIYLKPYLSHGFLNVFNAFNTFAIFFMLLSTGFFDLFKKYVFGSILWKEVDDFYGVSWDVSIFGNLLFGGTTLLEEFFENGSNREIHEVDTEGEYLEYWYASFKQPYWMRASGVSYAYLILESYYNYDPRLYNYLGSLFKVVRARPSVDTIFPVHYWSIVFADVQERSHNLLNLKWNVHSDVLWQFDYPIIIDKPRGFGYKNRFNPFFLRFAYIKKHKVNNRTARFFYN